MTLLACCASFHARDEVKVFLEMKEAANRGGLWRALKYVAPREQYDRDYDDDRYRHLTGCAVEKATVFRVTGLHFHDDLLG